MIYNIVRNKRIVITAIIAVLLLSGIVYKNTAYKTQIVLLDEEVKQEKQQEATVEEKEEDMTITVYVCGSVKVPANVSLPKDSRIEDAIKLAGGATEQADLNSINLAQKLSDEDMVYVPKKGEAIETGGKSKSTQAMSLKKVKLNINEATIVELDALPGVGPATAQKIIDYRKSCGGFKAIEEINNVSGIGDAKYKEFMDLITVD